MNQTTDSLIDSTLQWSSVLATGPEAQSFLQGQLSQDLATMSPDGAWSLLLAPDGVVVASLYGTPHNDGYALVVARVRVLARRLAHVRDSQVKDDRDAEPRRVAPADLGQDFAGASVPG